MTAEPARRLLRPRRSSVGGKPFSARNPTTIGAIGLVLVLVVLWAAFNADKLPLVGGGTSYSAYFTEAAGLRSGDPVRIAGVKVGQVESVGLADHRVKVTFTVKNAFVGEESTVAIKLKTLLGAKFLSVDSTGTGPQRPQTTIPVSRTSSPLDVYPAFTELTHTVDQIDTGELAKSLDVLSSDFAGTPASVQGVVTGLSRLSETISSRDAELRTLLAKANDVTGVLAARDQDLRQLLSDGGQLLDMLNQRRDAIHALLVNTTTLSEQLQGVVRDNQKTIGPLLDQLDKVISLLLHNQQDLDRGLSLLGPFYRVFTNTIGNGRWFDSYIQNLSPAGLLGLTGLGGA